MFDKNSNYALNKRDPEAIVYKSATGLHIRLTREDFDTEEEFLAWKLWSDQDLHEEEKENYDYAKHTVSLEAIPESSVTVPSMETSMELRVDRRRHIHHAVETVRSVQRILTQRQYRRLWMYCVEQMTQQQIAAIEGVGQRRISTSLSAAEKKIKKFFCRAKK